MPNVRFPAVPTFLVAIILLFAQPARAWDTAEHVRFGMQIASPFEDEVFGERIPVFEASVGATTFGHYVSAPDYARGLRLFLEEEPSAGTASCAELWSPAGVIDGVVVDDQASLEEPSLLTQATYADCLDGWRINNSHFGDFATNHFAYYHGLALEAARRYRRTQQPVCQQAAYTLEAWGQHYLTDSTASGHAWNPAGSYHSSFDWQTTNSVTQRMRIHNYLNDNGARFAGAQYEQGVVWGDHSLAHTEDGLSVPDRDGDWQRAVTLRLSRMALGQVISVAECGGDVRAEWLYEPRDDFGDARRFYVSDESMCAALYGYELIDWVPDAVELASVHIPEVYDAAQVCQEEGGALSTGASEAWLARHFFQDLYYHADTEDGFVHPAVDPQTELTLDELGCGEDLDVVPAATQEDLCGSLRCETPVDADGACPDGSDAYMGCCFVAPSFELDAGAVSATAWSTTSLPPVELLAMGAVPGESGEFLSFVADVPPVEPADYEPVGEATVSLPVGDDLDDCAASAQFSVHESRVRLPAASNLAAARLALWIARMDEGLRVEVNGRVVAHLDRVDADEGPVELPLLAPAVPPSGDGDYVVRLVHLNSCGTARPLEVAWVLTGAPDDGVDGVDDPGAASGGCNAGGDAGWGAACLLLLWIARRRRSTAARTSAS